MTAVLVTCAGQRVDIVTAFGRAGATTIATDIDPLAPALYHADAYALVPRVDDAAYLESLRDLVRRYDVRLVVPLTDLDHELLAAERDSLGDATVLLPALEVVRRTSDKYLSHRFFEERGIPSPASWLPDEVPAEPLFPVLVKARRGFGSRHIYRANDGAELSFYLERTPVPSFVQACCRGGKKLTSLRFGEFERLDADGITTPQAFEVVYMRANPICFVRRVPTSEHFKRFVIPVRVPGAPCLVGRPDKTHLVT